MLTPVLKKMLSNPITHLTHLSDDFSPFQLPGKVLFYDMSVSSSVTEDGSNRINNIDNLFNASYPLGQTTSTLQPLYIPNAYNGNHVTRFDGINDYFFLGSFGGIEYDYTQYLSMFIVLTPTTGVNRYVLSSGFAAGSPAILSNFVPNNDAYEWFAGNERATFASSASGLNVLTLIRDNNGNAKGYFNGVSVFDIPAVLNLVGLNIVLIGGVNGFPSQSYAGEIASMIICDVLLSDELRQKTEQYLMSKWGIA